MVATGVIHLYRYISLPCIPVRTITNTDSRAPDIRPKDGFKNASGGRHDRRLGMSEGRDGDARSGMVGCVRKKWKVLKSNESSPDAERQATDVHRCSRRGLKIECRQNTFTPKCIARGTAVDNRGLYLCTGARRKVFSDSI